MRLRASSLGSILLSITLGAPAAAQWVPQRSPTDAELRGLSVVSAKVAWASGQRGSVVRTTDGAIWTLTTIPGAAALDLRAIEGTSARTAHAISIGDSSRIYRTADGGRSWKMTWSATRKGTFLDAIRFWDARHGIALSDPVDGKFLLLTTDDGGSTWTEVPAGRVPAALPGEGAFAASGSCLTVQGTSDVWFGTGGARVARVFHSGDRGRTWQVYETPIRAGVASAGIFSVAFYGAKRGVIVGGDYQQPSLRGRNVAVTADGGMSWVLPDSATSPAGYRSAVSYVPGTGGRELVAVGLTGADVSRDRGQTWTQTDSVPYNSVRVATRWVGYAVGPKGRIARQAPTSATRGSAKARER